MRPWPFALLALACSSRPAPADPAPAAVSGDRREQCLAAQRVEVQAWLDHAVTAGDETETWATLGMVMTATEPEVLSEMREVSPEAQKALDSSAATWEACRGVISINCASLGQAAELTEERVGAEIWDGSELSERCAAGRVSEAEADCVLAARDQVTARSCFDGSLATR